MPLFPTTEFTSSAPVSHSPAYMSESQSLKTIASSTGAQRWEFEVSTAWLLMPEARAVWAFLNARGGRAQSFDIELPIHSIPNGVVSGAVTTGVNAVGATAITFANYAPAAGDFVRFAGHSKVYQVESAAGSIGNIYPPLLNATGLNEAVSVNNVLFTVRKSEDMSKIENNRKTAARLKFKCIEAF